MILTGNPSQVKVDAGEVAEIGCEVPGTPWRYCGAFYVAGADVDFILDYVWTWGKAGVVPDSIGSLIDSMVNDGRTVRAVKTASSYWSVGTRELYDEIRRRNQPKVQVQTPGARGGKATLLDRLRSNTLTSEDGRAIKSMVDRQKVNK